MIESSTENLMQMLEEIINKDDIVIDIKFEQLSTICSNKVYLISYIYKCNDVLQEKKYILKEFFSNRAIQNCMKEFDILKELNQISYIAPKVFFYNIKSNMIKNPHIVMEYLGDKTIEKSIFNSNNILKKYIRLKQCAKLLYDIHNTDITSFCYLFKIDKSELNEIQAEYLIVKRLKSAENICIEYNLDGFNVVIYWLKNNLNSVEWSSSRPCLIHQDFHMKNIIIRDENQYIIDWTEACLGDFRSDIAKIFMYYGKNVSDIILNQYEKISTQKIVSINYFVILESFFILFKSYYDIVYGGDSVDDYISEIIHFEYLYENIRNTLNLKLIPEVESLISIINIRRV
jgi:aminoglycoside phosphotransferase (APT) family kinase protein